MGAVPVLTSVQKLQIKPPLLLQPKQDGNIFTVSTGGASLSHPADEGHVSPVGAGRASELQDPHTLSPLKRVLGLPCLCLHHDVAPTGRQPK